MYHFVKFNNTWYLKPEKVQDIIDHFEKICGREFKEGFEDFRDNVVVKKDNNGEPYLYSINHSSSVWRNAVELCEMKLKGLNWLDGATSLEKRTFEDRINMFDKGKAIYFMDSLPYYCANVQPTYEDEVWKKTLEYPYEYQYDDCRFIQWPNGRHWYAKCGDIDIVDKYGNQKWSDKSYAQQIAKEWCKCGGNWDEYKSDEV